MKKVDKIGWITLLLVLVMSISFVYESMVTPHSTCGSLDDYYEEDEETEIVLRDVPYITIGDDSYPFNFSYKIAVDEYIAQQVYGYSRVFALFWLGFLAIQPIVFYIRIIAKKEYDDKKGAEEIIKRNLALGIVLILPMYLFNLLDTPSLDKPIIYIYPETETTVQVSVGYPEKLSCVYPEYNTEEGWEVIAKPNGDLVDTTTGRNLYCLYWEGNQKQEYKFKDGFVVAGEDSAKFLEEKLAILGLNEREANEFIIYWLPKLEANKYNLIRFETMEEIEEYMPLNVEPRPDTIIRIVMDFKGINRPVEIEEQKLEPVVREGYTVVEWGGSEF